MKTCYFLSIFSLLYLFSTNNTIALTLAECNQRGGGCICIAFPGTNTVCTRSQQASFLAQVKKEDPWSLLYKKLAKI